MAQVEARLGSLRDAMAQVEARLRGRVQPWIFWPAIAATLFSVAIGWRMKAACLDAHWGSPEPFSRRCYTDAQALWSHRGFADQWPYKDTLNEYPPGTALWQAVVGRLTETPEGFVHLNAALLGIVAVATTVVLLRAGTRHKALLWTLAPALVTYGAYNWDLLAALPTVAGLAAWMRGRTTTAGILVSFGVLAKWWPAVVLPLMAAALFHQATRRRLVHLVLASSAVIVGVNAAVWLWARDGYIETYRFHADRGATIESHWFTFQVYLDRWGFATSDQVIHVSEWGKWFLLAGALVAMVMVWRERLDVLHGSVALVALWQVAMPVLSMQYALWLVPLLVLARPPWRLAVAYLVADLLVFLAVMRFFAVSESLGFWEALETLALASVLRLLALLSVMAWAVWAGWIAAGKGSSGPGTNETGEQGLHPARSDTEHGAAPP